MQSNGGSGCPPAKFVRVQDWHSAQKNYRFFMIPKPISERLSINMQSTDTNWQTWLQPHQAAAWNTTKESTLKLSLETRNRGDILIVHCQGRIVYRDEASAL